MALAKNPQICKALMSSDYEVASHGWRWIDYQYIKKSEEKKHMKMAIDTHKKIFGKRPLGWYTGRCSPNTRDLVFEDGASYMIAILIVMICLIGRQEIINDN